MKTVQVQQVDVFTHNLFGGNPAGVVFDADILIDEEMKNIAREMNLSETAFILHPTKEGADVKLRYFTSGKAEIKFCGHATIGSLYEIGRTGRYGTKGEGTYMFRVETNAGILPMEIIKKSDNDIAVRFTAPEVELENYRSQHEEFAKRLDIPVSVINNNYPIMIDRNQNYIYLTINSLEELGKLEFNFQQIIDNFKEEKIVVFCLVTTETFERESNIHARGLAPLVGVPEDPFTGSMQGALATYAVVNGLVPEGMKVINTEQGNFIGRPGFAMIQMPSKENNNILVTGQGMHVFSTEITL